MEVARNEKCRNSWRSGKGSVLESSVDRRHGSGLESPLATQLQQAWLQTKLTKRNVSRKGFLSHLASADYHCELERSLPPYRLEQPQQHAAALSRSSSLSQSSPNSIRSSVSPQYSPHAFSEAYSSSEAGSAVNYDGRDEFGGDESNPMEEDMTLHKLSDVRMGDEEMADQKRPYEHCSAYQAVTKGLAELLGHRGAADGNKYGEHDRTSEDDGGDSAANSWIDEILNSSPHDFLDDEHTGESHAGATDLADEVSIISTEITNKTTGSPEPRSSCSTSKETTAATEKHNDTYDCLYEEYDRPENTIVDYINGRSGIESLADLYPLLLQCAQAVATDNVAEANRLINQLWLNTSPFGDGGQRMAFYIVEALLARLSGTGAQLYTALNSSRPSAEEMLKAYGLFVQCNPLPQISYFFANATILKAVHGSDRIHIIDYGILYGIQWPCLLKKLSTREGGPPRVRITGIDFAQPGFQKNDRVEDTGRRLQAKAKDVGVELEFHAIAGKWENITAAQLQLRDDETLVVNCMFRLKNLLDETVMASSPRKTVLSRIHSLNPKVFVVGVINAGYNSPFFMARVREAIIYFSAVFDAVHTTMPPDAPLRLVVEKEILGREILNVIGCEGTERIERAETYRQWQSRSINAGFKQLPLDPVIIAKAQDLLKNFNRNFAIAVDGNWLLTGWRDRVLRGCTAWTCT